MDVKDIEQAKWNAGPPKECDCGFKAGGRKKCICTYDLRKVDGKIILERTSPDREQGK